MTAEISMLVNGLIVGFGLGVVSVFLYLEYKARRVAKKAMKQIESIKGKVEERAKKLEGIKDKVAAVKDLSEKQMGLMDLINSPNKNALHARNKSSYVNEYQEIEKEKNGILKEILESGIDFSVTVMDASSGQMKEMKLSEYLQESQAKSGLSDDDTKKIKVDDTPPPAPNAKKVETKNGNWFVIDNDGDPDKVH